MFADHDVKPGPIAFEQEVSDLSHVLSAQRPEASTHFRGTSEIQRMIIGRAVTRLDVR
jgi:hypothetical protein